MIALMPFAVTGPSHAGHSQGRHGQPGKSGEVVNVKPGYGRNYLLPRGLAVWRPPTTLRADHDKRVIAAREAKLAKEAQAEADQACRRYRSDRARGRRRGQALRLGHRRDIAEALWPSRSVTVDARRSTSTSRSRHWA